MKLNRIEAGSRLVLEFFEALNRQDLAKMLNYLSADCLLESAAPAPQGKSTTLRGADLFKIKGGLICEQISYVKSNLI